MGLGQYQPCIEVSDFFHIYSFLTHEMKLVVVAESTGFPCQCLLTEELLSSRDGSLGSGKCCPGMWRMWCGNMRSSVSSASTLQQVGELCILEAVFLLIQRQLARKILPIARRNGSQRGNPQPHLRQMADNSLFGKCSGNQETEWEGGISRGEGSRHCSLTMRKLVG